MSLFVYAARKRRTSARSGSRLRAIHEHPSRFSLAPRLGDDDLHEASVGDHFDDGLRPRPGASRPTDEPVSRQLLAVPTENTPAQAQQAGHVAARRLKALPDPGDGDEEPDEHGPGVEAEPAPLENER